MKKHSLLLVAFGLTLAAHVAAAESSESNASASDPGSSTYSGKGSLLKNKQYEDTKVLTDPNLRANDGSLSRYSFKGSLAYSGPTLGDLSAQNQPNPDKSVGNFAQKITGNVTGNYRVDPTHFWGAGVGLIMSYPFAGSSNAQDLLQKSNAGSSQFSPNNPFVSYGLANRWDSLQMRNSFIVIDSTQPVYTSLGEIGGLNYYNGLVYGLGSSKVSLSFDTTIYYWIFSRAYNAAPRSQGGDSGSGAIQQYTLSLTPGVKYNFTDSLNVYTTAGLGWQNLRDQTGNLTSLQPRSLAVSAGVGWAYKRDIYVAPYITTYPFSVDEGVNETSINLSTTFSIM